MNWQEAIDAEDGHGTVISFETHFDVIRLPRAFLLIFTEAHGVLARPAEGRPISVAGKTSADGDEYQANRAADGGVCSKTRTEHAGVAIDVERGPDRTVEKQRRTDVAGGCLHAVKIEPGLADRFDSDNNHRQVFRQASGHDGVDGQLLYARGRPPGRDEADHLLRITGGALEH